MSQAFPTRSNNKKAAATEISEQSTAAMTNTNRQTQQNKGHRRVNSNLEMSNARATGHRGSVVPGEAGDGWLEPRNFMHFADRTTLSPLAFFESPSLLTREQITQN